MNALRELLNDLADIQARREQEADAIDAGEHNDYGLYDELEDDIADLLIDRAAALAALLDKADLLAATLGDLDAATDSGGDDDGNDEAIRVAARDLLEDTPTAAVREDLLAAVRAAHTQALHAADGDSNDDEIAAWRETAELATAFIPGYEDPTID